MKVAYITIYNAQNLKKYSGTAYYLSKSLEDAGVEVVYIGNLKLYSRFTYRIKERLLKLLFNKIYIPERSPKILKYYAKQINEKLKTLNVDVLLSPSSIPLSLVNTEIPIVIFSDSIFAGMINFYLNFTNLTTETVRNGHWQEQEMLNRATLAIFSSEWAANSVKSNYIVEDSKIKVLSYGANIESSRTEQDIIKLIIKKKSTTCKLLFIGVDWKRKGGNIALAVTELLNKMGHPTELVIVGCNLPKMDKLPPYVKVYNFIDKSTEAGKQLIDSLIEESHFLFLPSEADCTPIVFAEANSFGVPCISKNVGGISSVISNGVNGVTLNIDAGYEEYARFVIDSFVNYNNYEKLSLSSFKEYQARLNWKVTGDTLKDMLSVLAKKIQ